MDAEANKRLIHRLYEEVWARGNVAFAKEVFADDYPPARAGERTAAVATPTF